MPLPLIVGLGVVSLSGFLGTAGTVSAIEKTNKCTAVQRSADDILRRANENMEYYRTSTKSHLEALGKTKLTIAADELKDFVDIFSKLKNVELLRIEGFDELDKIVLQKDFLMEMRSTATKAVDVFKTGLAGVGAGALIGWGVYGGVSTFAVTGGGAAIGALSGAAATNATLAWIGGGTLAAGGFGVAGGTVLLGGLIAAPALALMSGIASIAAGKRLDDAYSNRAEAEMVAEQVNKSGMELHHICSVAVLIKKNLKLLERRLNASNNLIAEIVLQKTEWNQLTIEEKHDVALAYKYAALIKSLIDMPLLGENGLLTKEAQKMYSDHKKKVSTVSATGAKITEADINDWKKKNVCQPDEAMCIIDPLAKTDLLKSVQLPAMPAECYVVIASVHKATGEIVCYSIVDRKAVDLSGVKIKNN